jgi:hypothetical protein
MDFREFLSESIATLRPIRREFEFGGKKIEGYFLDLPAIRVRELMRSQEGDRDAIFLAAVVCDAAGGPLLTVEQALGIKPAYLQILVQQALTALGLSEEGHEEAKKP